MAGSHGARRRDQPALHPGPAQHGGRAAPRGQNGVAAVGVRALLRRVGHGGQRRRHVEHPGHHQRRRPTHLLFDAPQRRSRRRRRRPAAPSTLSRHCGRVFSWCIHSARFWPNMFILGKNCYEFWISRPSLFFFLVGVSLNRYVGHKAHHGYNQFPFFFGPTYQLEHDHIRW